MAQNEQTTEEHSTLERQSPGRLDHPAWCVVWTVSAIISNYGESVALSGSSSNVKVAGHRLQSQDEKYAVPFVLPHGG